MFKGWKKSKSEEVKPTVALDSADKNDYDVVVSMLSDVGCVREINEDSGRYTRPKEPDLASRRGTLVLVADGMGGHSAGEVASHMAVELIDHTYYNKNGTPRQALEAAFHAANKAINQRSTSNPTMGGMGTTCTALALQNGSAIAAHVGDTRLYMIRNGQIYLMTEDHSAVMEMVKRGWISLDEARHHPEKNVILRALGSHEDVEVTIWETPLPIKPGDKFLLCSDGLYDLVEDEEMKRIAEANLPAEACSNLIALAKQRGGHDNITVAIVSLQPRDSQPERPAPETRQVEVPR
ncbi:MAG TPA: Stp1/IreP family PP2C-type Ser/Thr phosphatase [Blastocatellia bacterium]|nr:Stp1/IreP family PP2C-type Ser/Thr phosphatase [Blastocatellia bacterium]